MTGIGAMLGSAPEWAKAIDSGQHLTDVSSLAVNHAAIPNFLTAFRDQGVRTDHFEPFQAILDRAMTEATQPTACPASPTCSGSDGELPDGGSDHGSPDPPLPRGVQERRRPHAHPHPQPPGAAFSATML